MQTSVPDGPIRSATSCAWPPAPNVQSTASSPSAGAVRSISSPASTGTCVAFMSRRIAKSLGHLRDLRVEPGLGVAPALGAPDLQVVTHAHDHNVLADAAVVQ